MRKIKFRAWDKENKKWIIGNDEIFIKIGHCYSSNINQNVDLSGLVIMQYTGLKDKNGKEIYEGDIVIYGTNLKTDEPIKYLVIWDDKEAKFSLKEIEKPFLIINPFSIAKYGKIIGNIYENPELLKNN